MLAQQVYKMTFLRTKPVFVKLQAAQFTNCRSQKHINNVNNHLPLKSLFMFKFNPEHRENLWERCFVQFSGLASCNYQKVPSVLKEQNQWTNSPRGFYMHSPKYATIMYDLLKPPTNDEDIAKLFHLRLHASKDDFLKSVKELNCLPTSIVQDIFNRNLRFITQGIASIRILNEEVLREYLRLFAKIDITCVQQEMRTFEQKCVDQMETWPVDMVLLVSDAFHLINYRSLSYNKKMYEYMRKHVPSLNKHNIVQLAYLIGENRIVPSALMHQLQKRILNFKNEFTVPEIGAIFNGFFKSKTSITSDILSIFAKRLMLEDTREINTYSLVGILKMYRYAYFGSEMLFNKIANEIVERIPTMEIAPVTHIALTYSTLRMFHAPLMDMIAQVYVSKVKYGRCKDVTKCLWSVSTLAHRPPNFNQFYKTALHEMRRRSVEYSEHPNHLTSGLIALAYMDIYPLDIIDYVFSPTFLDFVKNYRLNSKIDLRPDLHLLDCTLAIDRPLYCGNRFPQELLKEGNLPDDFYPNVDHELSKRKFLKPVISCLSDILGDAQLIKPHFILQHMKALDIEFRLSESGEPITVSKWNCQHKEKKKTLNTASILVQKIMQGCPLEEASIKQDHSIAIVLWSRNHYQFGAKQHITSRHLLGLHAMKRRHLLLLGYKIVELPFYELEVVSEKGNTALTQYLKQKLVQLPQMRTLLQGTS
ncbi:FAST kinase domain-containing protein 5, mitochondrial-like [Anneissia japonica]|uniref:FAST kinase domain-containing protein 5, mitochondrial-like n=1 Tax=Anneissia japonica TaxID=1529436 RepID=UPI0014258E30|nr:FAST kinase domain-containing protein 5, mitochondrial-like [Anneissia japonica]XP_033108820.1 FAST kinase domain-containing protein 5, mitochondrial-like [Anneissia japonica]